MPLFSMKLSDRTMTRETWKALDRASRALGRKIAPEIDKATTNALLYGVSGYHVGNDGDIRAASIEELEEVFLKESAP